MYKLLYISTNASWSGSEILWHLSAKRFISQGFQVAVVTRYQNLHIDSLNLELSARFDLTARYIQPTRRQRLRAKVLRTSIKTEDRLLTFIKSYNPDLIIISQGNNIDSLEYQKLFLVNNFKYCTITQLVTEFHWLSISNESLNELRDVYAKSAANFFISQANIALHNRMLASEYANSELVYNPGYEESSVLEYPATDDSYKMAFVGRLECFHKGLDILIQVIAHNKWRSRNLHINFYGSGPHHNWLTKTIENLKLTNVTLKGFSADVRDVWKENHLLILPSRMEGQALSLIEAQMCGRAAIATNVGGAAEIIDDNISGFLAKFPTIEFLDEAMERAWAQKDNWEQIGEAAQKKMQQFPADVAGFFNSKIENLLA